MKVYFTDFWVGLKQTDNFIYNALCKHYTLEIDESFPEVLFFSCYGNNHMKYNDCVKIYYTGENDTPNFTWCDYAMGFDYMEFGDRYMRLPQYAIQPRFKELYEQKTYSIELCNRKFCNFVYSNNYSATPLRVSFFEQLSNYKKVDSGGRYMNNIGGPIADKFGFISQYKFTIAIENSRYLGYTTEKLIEPMVCESIPIYYGNPEVQIDFNPDSFVWIKDEGDVKRAIDEIEYLDNNDEAYIRKLSSTKLVDDKYRNVDDLIVKFLGHIFESQKEESYRMPRYGFIREYNNFVLGIENWDNLRNPTNVKNKKTKIIMRKMKNIIRMIKTMF